MPSVSNIYKHDELNSREIANSFYEYAASYFEPYSVNKKSVREIEMSIVYPPLSWMSVMFNNSKKVAKSYLEINTKLKESPQSKIRIRKDISSFSHYINNKRDMGEIFKRETKELKVHNHVHKYHNNITFKNSDESLIPSINTLDVKNLSFIYANSISISNSYFRAEIRIRSNLKTSNENNNDLIMSYFQNKNISRAIDLEIELNTKLTSLEKDKFIDKFLSIFRFVVGSPTTDFFLYFGTQDESVINVVDNLDIPIRTEMVNIADVIKMPYKDMVITKKIDGKSKQFHVIDSKCIIVNNGLLLELETNIVKNFELIGIGEYVIQDGERCIIPFYFEVIKKNGVAIPFSTRTESFNIFEKQVLKKEKSVADQEYLSHLKKDSKFGVVFRSKEFYSSHSTQKEFINNVYNVYNKLYDLPTDGVVLIPNNVIARSEVVDYKFKKNNTIDLHTSLTLGSKNSNSMDFSFSLFAYNPKNKEWVTEELFANTVSSSPDMYYDNDSSMIVFKNQGISELYPVFFISEYSMDGNTFKPRMDKTSLMFSAPVITKNNRPRRPYSGNSPKVIMHSFVLHKYKMNLNTDMFNSIREYSPERLLEYADETEKYIQDMIKEEAKIFQKNEDSVPSYLTPPADPNDFIIEPLNMTKAWYKEKTNVRTSLNHFSNWNKTIGLYLAVGTFVTKQKYRSVFSIYCGKGGDMGKFVSQGITSVVGIDPDKRALAVFQDRLKSYSRDTTKVFDLTTIALSLENKDFLRIVQEKTGPATYDLIDCQLGIHFSFNKTTEDHIGTILRNLVNKNKPIKTRMIISTNDKTNIMKAFESRKSDLVVFKIDEKNSYTISKKNDDQIGVFYDASMGEEMLEYLIDKEYFTHYMDKLGFELHQTWGFDEMIQDPEMYRKLSERYERKSSKEFLDVLFKQERENNELIELLSIFRYYIFEYRN